MDPFHETPYPYPLNIIEPYRFNKDSAGVPTFGAI
jgi:hypothetical protein